MSLEAPPIISSSDGIVAAYLLQPYLQRLYSEHVNYVGDVITVSTGVGVNIEFVVAHKLERIPSYVQVLVAPGQTDDYLQVKPSGTAWTSTSIYLKCNKATATLTLRII